MTPTDPRGPAPETPDSGPQISREMTLAEWVNALPPHHRARKEYGRLLELERESAALRAVISACHEAVGEDAGSDDDSLPDVIRDALASYKGHIARLESRPMPPPDPITDEEAEELERLEKAATPGPWVIFVDNGATEYRRRHPRQMIGSGSAMRSVIAWSPVDEQRRADHELVGASRNALPRLLSSLRASRRAAEAARENLKCIADGGLAYNTPDSVREMARAALAIMERI